MDLGLQGKTVVVTGASKGIGYATAEAFLKEGAKVAVCSRHEDELKEAAQTLSEKCIMRHLTYHRQRKIMRLQSMSMTILEVWMCG